MTELRYAIRALAHARLYSTTVIAVIGMAMALVTVTFAVVDGVLFKPLPFTRADDLFVVRADIAAVPRVQLPPVGSRDVTAWREIAPDVPGTLVRGADAATSTRLDGRDYWQAGIDDRFFDVLGVSPLTGGFSQADFDWTRTPADALQPVLISHRLWQTMLAGDVSAVGRKVVMSERAGIEYGWRVAGILPADFVFPLDEGAPQPDVLTPIGRVSRDRGAREFQYIVRVPDGADVSRAGSAFTAESRRLGEAPPLSGHQPSDALQRLPFDSVQLIPVVDRLARQQRPSFRLVLAGSVLLLLLGAVNIAGLAAARNVTRRRELMVRRALGAGTWQIARGVISEVLLLVAAGTVLGVVMARPLLDWTLSLLPPAMTLLKPPVLDARVFGAAGTLAAVCVVLVSVWPAWVGRRMSRPGADLQGGSSTRATRRSSFGLVALQVALGFVLMTAGALTVLSLARAWQNDTGYRRDRMVLLEVFVNRYSAGVDAMRQLEELDAVLRRVPGAELVAFSGVRPLFTRRLTAWTEWLPQGWSGSLDTVQSRPVSDTFFDVMGLPLVEGRWPEPGEWVPDQPVAVVSQKAARILWPDQKAVGRVLISRTRAVRPSRTVIAVVADTRFSALDEDPLGEIYVPDRFDALRTGAFFHIRTAGAAGPVLRRILPVLSTRHLYVTQAWTHEDALFASVRHRVLAAWLFGSLGASALAVLGVGVLGLLAMSTSQRIREVGIRCALGATPARIVRMLFMEHMAGVVTGLGIGAILSWWLVRYLGSVLYRVQPHSPAAWSLVVTIVIAVAVVGTLIPSVRAACVDPVRALRVE
jgi:putative ABC transport system permease protein